MDSVPTEQRMSAEFLLPSSALSTRLAPSVYGQASIQPGRVHTLPPNSSSASYSKKVLKRANRLQLLPKQEHTRLTLSQCLITTKQKSKKKSRLIDFSNIRVLANKLYLISVCRGEWTEFYRLFGKQEKSTPHNSGLLWYLCMWLYLSGPVLHPLHVHLYYRIGTSCIQLCVCTVKGIELLLPPTPPFCQGPDSYPSQQLFWQNPRLICWGIN